MSVIGGYFGLELNDFGSVYHDKAVALNTGRNALEYILFIKKYKKVFIPYYTCDVTLQPIKRLNVDFEFYHLDENFSPIIESIKEDEVLLYVNYFGILNNKLTAVIEKYINVIIDNAQAFFVQPINNVSTFYSPRKFFGMSDGGFAYVETNQNIDLDQDISLDRISHLIKRIENGAEAGYKSFLSENTKLDNIPFRKMSLLTNKLLRNINFDKVRNIRNNNFKTIHSALGSINELTPLIESEFIDGPMSYPFLKKGNEELKKNLIEKKVFVATYWPNVKIWLKGKDCYELYLYNNLIPIPIDQRYNGVDMNRIIELIK